MTNVFTATQSPERHCLDSPVPEGFPVAAAAAEH